ncbi:glycoside hydrolase family 47 protein [Heterostelium album PN500]|uniref:alpha-1,2-Mannosidase n=1 Tax=Heterostelium pallidum (strain ATCC 26659 / Pp 5 / PN500) TaxID=670386 RepID=D3B8S4_HETP5|nr:glycoside hydrolase family 47 protein [Heterostelium album PN500]EFA82442.1 glycoside hydrolase family 47 protein [Heterostelium album PN500]|eukprot:XP_020434559.1 glycoside hydrolase family 47 protein [Heterostelium album PN500]
MLKKNVVLAVFTAVFLIGSITILSFDSSKPMREPPSVSIKWKNVLVSNITNKVKTTKKPDIYKPGDFIPKDSKTPSTTGDAANNGVPLINDEQKKGGGHEMNRASPFDKTKLAYEANREKNIERASAVRNAMKFAWDRYVEFAWGDDELTPLQKKGKNWFHLGLSIVDGMDTLYFMGLEEEFATAREWVATKLDHRKDTGEGLSVFEVTIRMLGAYLAMYEQTGDQMFLEKAEDIGNILLMAFPSDSPFPKTYLNFAKGTAKIPSWSGNCLIMADVGTLFIEFTHLSKLTGKSVWADKAAAILDKLDAMPKTTKGLIPIYVRPDGSGPCGSTLSMGSMADSYYEYLLKMWLYTPETHPQHNQYRRMYLEAVEAMHETLYTVSPKGEGYLSIIYGRENSHTMEHLACMAGGMFALGVAANITQDDKLNKKHFEMAEQVTKTCVNSYFNSKSGLGPEQIYFDPRTGEQNIYGSHGKSEFILRPEAIESVFYMWRLTGDPKYQDWGWKMFEALEKHCRTPNGFVGIRDVNKPEGAKDDIQQSFFLAETIKYFYLLFADPSIIPLDKYVFNTEAHPIPIQRELKY